MYDYLAIVVSQENYNLALAIIGGGMVSYALASALSSRLIGIVLFPGLTLGGLASMALAKHAGLIIGRDKDLYLMGTCAAGLMVTLFAYYVLYNLLDWLLSYNRREHRMLIQRSNEASLITPQPRLPLRDR